MAFLTSWQYRWNQLHSDMHACGKQLRTACDLRACMRSTT